MKLKPMNVVLAGLLIQTPVFADQLEPISVTSVTKTERALTQSPVSVEVINEASIRELNALTLGDVLEKTGAVFMNPDQRSMSIRGVGSKGTLLLIDGRRIGTEFTKNYDAKRIPAASIERIEIVKGPMGALYGSDALGGVIKYHYKTGARRMGRQRFGE
ncbi:MAG: TonB-dependent receptor plug domain-containing protein [Thiomicrospira sp.]|jgi:outer membrane receptor for ferrienterochelin and colicins|nr:TonB-dependent receptor plug domain-containing protein [Thiomicrospira sp.]